MTQDSRENTQAVIIKRCIKSSVFSLQSRRGQVMVESIVALVLLTFGITGIFVLFSNSLSLNHISTEQYIASGLASEGIEIVKNILDTNRMNGRAWNSGLLNCLPPTGCSIQYDSTSAMPLEAVPLNLDKVSGIYSYNAAAGSNQPTKFTRTLTIGNVVNNEIIVTSKVDWVGLHEIPYNVTLEDHMFDWRTP